MQTIHDIYVRSVSTYVIMHQERLVVLIETVNAVIHTGNGIEVTKHHPILGSRIRNRTDGLVANVLHFLRTEHVTLLFLAAFCLIFSLVSIPLRPRVQRDNVYLLAADFHLSPTGAMHHDDIIPVSVHPLHDTYRVLGSDYLGKRVTLAADEHILMSVTPRKEIPVPWKIELVVLRHLHIGAGTITRFRLTPYADIRVLRLHILHEIVIIVLLIGPHPVLDVPIENFQVPPRSRKRQHQDEDRKDKGQ